MTYGIWANEDRRANIFVLHAFLLRFSFLECKETHVKENEYGSAEVNRKPHALNQYPIGAFATGQHAPAPKPHWHTTGSSDSSNYLKTKAEVMHASNTPRTSGTLRFSIPKPFKGRLSKGTLTLVAAQDLNERSWGAWFGDIQVALDERQLKGQNINVCMIDLRSCMWADPLPLLSLALSLANFEAKGGEVQLLLPDAYLSYGINQRADSEQDTHQRDSLKGERLLKFMAREGFLDLLTRTKPITKLEGSSQSLQPIRQALLGSQQLKIEDFSPLRQLRCSLAFEESTCVPAVLLDLRTDAATSIKDTLECIDRWVIRTIQTRIHPVVTDKVPAWAHGGLLYRLQILLRETLHNIVEHAYGVNGGLAAIYVRYREGRLGQAPTAWSAMEPHIKREDDSKFTALMRAIPTYQSFARTRAGFFEVYVLDGGCGLIERLLENEAVRHLRDSENPLHHVMLEVFNGRSTRPDRPTEKGGIYLLRHLLEPSRDYLRVRDADAWWGQELPLPMMQSISTPAGQVTQDCGPSERNCLPIHGLAWTARLSWLDRMDSAALPEVGNWREMTQMDRLPLLSILRNKRDMVTEISVSVEDWRLTGSAWRNQCQNHDSEILVVLPHRDWMKNRIQDRIAEAVKTNRLHANGTLVVGDIVSEEALTYLLAIRRARRLAADIRGVVNRIILITRDLRSIVLHLQDGLYHEDEQETQAFVSGKAAWSLADYFGVLRSNDGRRLWETINSSEDGPLAAFRREWVDWHDGRCLDGYLDFPSTLTNPICRTIYNLTLEHLIALFPQRDCRLIPLDNLVESLVIRFRAQQRPRRSTRTRDINANAINVYVGSVRVTGFTQNDHTLQNENPTIFHFFSHPSGESFGPPGNCSTGYYLLPWLESLRGLPPHDCTVATQQRNWYRRIGRTPGIAQGGWKAFRVPRFDEEGQSLYEATPYETYSAWQDPSRTPLRLGHWSYGGHHDLLTVNLLLAFDTELNQISLALGGRLARYVYANLFTALGISREHLIDEGKRLWDMIEKDAFRRLIPEDKRDQGGILIFPSHPVTDHVLGRLTGWLQPQDKLHSVLSRCVPILPLRRHRGGSGLQLSGLTLERLQSFVTKDAPPRVTYFDDAMISGHTFQQMKSLLHGIGFDRVYSVIMLDRQRLPSAHHVNRKVDQLSPAQTPAYQNVCYWRLDAPTIGSRAHCPLCKGLGRVKDLAGIVESPERRERALRWLEIWAERNPATDWGDAGLRPIPLELSKPNRKFCITPDPDNTTDWKQDGVDGKEIVLTNSAGLVAWVTELHSITARDDLAVKLLDPHAEKLSPEARIQLCASQLLLFHGEFDRDLAAKIGYQLALALYEAPTHDRNTALAAISLIACGNKFLATALKMIQPAQQSPNDNIVTDNETNLDFLTLLELSTVMDTGPNNSQRPSPPSYTAQLRHENYRLLQETICSGEPEHHSSPFSRLQDLSSPLKLAEHGTLKLSDRETLERVIEAAASLKRRLAEIKPDWFRYHGESESLIEIFPDFLKTVESRLKDLTKPLKSILSSRAGDKVDLDLNPSKALAKEVLEDGHRVALAVFTPLGFASLKEGNRPAFLDELQKVVSTARVGASKAGWSIEIAELSGFDYLQAAKKLNGNKAEYYVVWDRLIGNALDRILSNVRYAKKTPIRCPWPLLSAPQVEQLEAAHLWVRLDIRIDEIAIIMQNQTETRAKDVMMKTESQPWVKTFKELGGGVTYSDVDGEAGNLLETTVRIPYTFSLESPNLSEQRSRI